MYVDTARDYPAGDRGLDRGSACMVSLVFGDLQGGTLVVRRVWTWS